MQLIVSNSQEPQEFVGPAPFFRLDGGALQSAPDFHDVAHHLGFIWEYAGHLYKRLESTTAAMIHFEGRYGAASETVGPFTKLSVVDGVVYGDGERIASLADGQDAWRLDATQECWPIMVVKPSERA